jgi:hypothetical protein
MRQSAGNIHYTLVLPSKVPHQNLEIEFVNACVETVAFTSGCVLPPQLNSAPVLPRDTLWDVAKTWLRSHSRLDALGFAPLLTQRQSAV